MASGVAENSPSSVPACSKLRQGDAGSLIAVFATIPILKVDAFSSKLPTLAKDPI